MEVEPTITEVSSSAASLPWVEKYRPKRMSDVTFQDEAVQTLKKSIEDGNLPHLLLYGPPGTGKTSVILALARELFGPEMKNRVMELNASDERGIDVIRMKVKAFAEQSVKKTIPCIDKYIVYNRGYPSPPFKIIVMDEADSLTMDAQSALRRVMEVHSKVTRFCFICNYISRIIPALSSRCAKFEFAALPQSNVVDRLRIISDHENMQIDVEALEYIYAQSKGDLRSGIHLLQNSQMIYKDEVVTKEKLQRISMEIPEFALKNLWEAITKTATQNNITLLTTRVEKIIMDGYSLSLLLSMLCQFVVDNKELDDIKKADICLTIADADKAAIDGCDEELILLNTCCSIVKTISNTKVVA